MTKLSKFCSGFANEHDFELRKIAKLRTISRLHHLDFLLFPLHAALRAALCGEEGGSRGLSAYLPGERKGESALCRGVWSVYISGCGHCRKMNCRVGTYFCCVKNLRTFYFVELKDLLKSIR